MTIPVGYGKITNTRGVSDKFLYTTVLCDNFPRFACWGDLILSEFQNQFCACLAQPGKKCESGSIFNIKMPVSLQVGY